MRVVRLIRDIFSEIMDDDLLNWSAALAYYFLFSLFPLVLLAAAMLGALNMVSLVNGLIGAIVRILPHEAAVLVAKQLTHLVETRHTGLMSVGTALVLYSASQAFTGLMSALNAAYEVPETRSYFHRLGLALALTFSAGVLILISLVGLLFGHRFLLHAIGIFHVSRFTVILWTVLRWSVIMASLVGAMMLLYRMAPNVRHHNTGFLPAAVTALVLWSIASLALGMYINHFSNYSATYGSLGAVIGLMLWFYIFALSLLVGAEVHSEILKRKGIYCKPRKALKQSDQTTPQKAA